MKANQPKSSTSPIFPSHHNKATTAGHGGGDFFTTYHFADAIRTGEQPYLDVYRGIDMSLVGILAWRSALNDAAPVEVPDFRVESARQQYENDDWSPDPRRKKKVNRQVVSSVILSRRKRQSYTQRSLGKTGFRE